MALKHPENRGDRNPLSSRTMRRQMRQNRFVPKPKNAAPRAGTEIDLPQPGSKPETPVQPAQPAQPNQGDPVPVQ